MASDDAVAEAQERAAIKDRVRATFGAAAEAYVAGASFASGADLRRLVELAAPVAEDVALDVSTGGGHTALALAPSVGQLVVSDLTPRMLAAARAHLLAQGVRNALFVIADAEQLPFLDESFSLVTVRIAPHHYADPAQAVREIARVLRPGGRLAFVDNLAPEDPLLDTLINDWDRRRDPSHVREYTASQWHSMFAAAGLRVTTSEIRRKANDYQEWTERVRMPAEERRALEADILNAPAQARAHFEILEREGRLVSWTPDYLIVRAEKDPPTQQAVSN